MTKSKIKTMLIDALIEGPVCNEPEMNILKIVIMDKCIRIIYKERSQGLKTTLNHMENALDRIGFIYLHGYYEEIKKNISTGYLYILGNDCDYFVECCYDSDNRISTFVIQIDRWLK